ncbi:2-amino-4-hydroxy-6-hydroxymethyldihydropteridine diphosphokinase [Larsenimonas rhizosphaerae]|uniref:2-amino-4-hydroxy-6-hydroxymethyldihydropteridine diphosphokinase n=1 Tax=Larsenimonas rhizosphaerae TaxID=2944682 RepID=A0AA42CT74_9GAMM|nr:2-amino-4-hydroxy-6-hydroxymethyldihydropteridine diphosphokinase [Larsenimonas rhizosphaerae]MCX2522874.1 2-amino-4-hydroxy-6-hydroxymethyldihydropteridine diphosphokinase [Larsenimonas rhizosphaerae]
MTEVLLGIGSNLNPTHHLRLALDALNARFGPIATSRVFESQPVGFDSTNLFYNMVVAISTPLPPEILAEQLKAMEYQLGRPENARKFASRVIDIDVLTHGESVLQKDGLVLPRNDITQYAFVLKPLAELRPHTPHPALGTTYQALWQQFSTATPQPLTPIHFEWQGRCISSPDAEHSL